MREPDACFAEPRQAELYDHFEGERPDLDAYLRIVEEVGAAHVLDIGCGTGSLAVLLAGRGLTVTAVDPADASLRMARSKPFADRVRWIHGDATALTGLGLAADLAVMTGNVAQVFVTDDDWIATLQAIRGSLRLGGRFVVETRRAEVRDWETWGHGPTEVTLPDGRTATQQCTITEVALPLVSFTGSTLIGDEVLRSSSTLRFRDSDEVTDDLRRTGFGMDEIREAPDRPGKEMVFLARAV